MVIRYTSSVLFGTVIAIVLLYLMQTLIETGRPVISSGGERPRLDFVRVERTDVFVTKDAKPEKTPEPESRPAPARIDGIEAFGPNLAVSVTSPEAIGRSGAALAGFGMSDGEYLPIVKVAPAYPVRALERGLEGYVRVGFTVTAAGSTRDVRVIESSSAVFEQAAVESAKKYRYRPRVINGEPVEVPGVETLIRFAIEN